MRGIGAASITERARMMKASLKIDAALERGVVITIETPLGEQLMPAALGASEE